MVFAQTRVLSVASLNSLTFCLILWKLFCTILEEGHIQSGSSRKKVKNLQHLGASSRDKNMRQKLVDESEARVQRKEKDGSQSKVRRSASKQKCISLSLLWCASNANVEVQSNTWHNIHGIRYMVLRTAC